MGLIDSIRSKMREPSKGRVKKDMEAAFGKTPKKQVKSGTKPLTDSELRQMPQDKADYLPDDVYLRWDRLNKAK